MTTNSQLFRICYSIFVILIAVMFFGHFGKRVETAKQEENSQIVIENYDIRIDKSSAAQNSIDEILSNSNFSRLDIANYEKATTNAAESFRKFNPTVSIEFDHALKIPEIISPSDKVNPLFSTGQNEGDRSKALFSFINSNAAFFGITENQISSLLIASNYDNPDKNLSFVHLRQYFKTIPVFQAELKAGFTKNGEIVRIINNLAPNIVDERLNDEFGNSQAPIISAARHIGISTTEADLRVVNSNDLKTTFENGQFENQTTAEKFYFPVANGVAVPAWRVLLWTKNAAYYVLVDASNGKLLWRKNITESQTLTANFQVYANPTSLLQTEDSPSPCTPGCNDPDNCPQPSIIMRSAVTLIGNEPPYSFNNLGWIPDSGLAVRSPANPNITDGNNCEAGIDRDGTNGVDPLGHANGNPLRVFNFAYNPAPGNPPPGDNPIPPNPQPYPPTPFQQGVTTHGFYLVNRWHDEMYRLGFTEAAGNFQHFNFGRGGMEGDRVSFEIQDGSGTNGANFSTPADGARGRMQMFVWTGSTPARDGALDGTIVVHEITHGLSNRLHGNTAGLLSNMARGMGEGWSDFYALALLSEASDAPCGVYPVGSYVAFQLIPGYTANHYYGIRRFPTARRSCLGSNGMPHNPVTFGNLNAGNCSNFPSAYPVGPFNSGNCDQIHKTGEIWAQALWEVRGNLIAAHGWAEGNRRALQYVTDGMKLSPLNPNMLQSRDAIVAATSASNPGDISHVWQGFALRGMGFSANIASVDPAVVTEAFDPPNVRIGTGFLVSDEPGNNNGFPEPGERLRLTIPLTNNSGATVTGVTLQIEGGSSAFYGDVQNGQTISQNINYTVPSNAPCPGNFTVRFNINSSAGSRTETRTIFLGVPTGGPPITFSSSVQIDLPAGQPAVTSGAASPYPSSIQVSGLTGRKMLKLEITGISHTFPSDLDFLLVSPAGQKFIFLSDSGGGNDVNNLTFTLGDAATSQPSTSQWMAGNFRPYNLGANDAFVSPAPSVPYFNAAPAGQDSFSSVFGQESANLNGTWNLYAVDDAGPDSGIMSGWKLTFESNDYTCIICRLCPTSKARADFDGDGTTDISVFRPSEGNWYLNGSTAGFSVGNWGISSDKLAPGDFDGDGKTDFAVFRANADSAQPDFYILNSSNFTFSGYSWGLPGDIPIIEDYDGDGKDDVAVHRPSDHISYILRSGSGSVLTSRPQLNGRIVAGDFDGDGKGDFVVFSNGQWFLSRSSDNHQSGIVENWGLETDKLVPADYDGDGIDDLAVYRPSEQVWYIRKSSGGNTIVQFGLANDIPVSGDYDGDGKNDIAVYRDGTWYIIRSIGGILITQFGLGGDKPIPNEYLPQ